MNLFTLGGFHNLHRMERCFIVCNGPSLNRMNLNLLRNETVIGLNKIHLGLARFGFYPSYLVVVNPKVAEQSHQEISNMTAIKFIGARAASFFPTDALTYHVPILDPPVAFSKDITAGLREGGTVTHAALQIAFFLGFTEVIIVGMDHRYSFTGTPHEAQYLEGRDPNHFSSNYFRDQTWDNPNLKRSEDSYAEARRIYEAAGRRIVDATVNGACTVFEKCDYKTIVAR